MGKLKIGRMVLGMYQTNCYFVYREGENKAIVFDPADQGERIVQSLLEKGKEVAAIMLTHGHFDHIGGCDTLKKIVNERNESDGKAPVKVYACEAEKNILHDIYQNISAQMRRPCKVTPDVYLKDEDVLDIEGIKIKVFATPGHTEGGCCYYFEEEGILICGDTLFLESVGRTDFPTGSMSELVRSVKEKLFVLPDSTKAYPGHGDSTTIGHEKKYNPFCAD